MSAGLRILEDTKGAGLRALEKRLAAMKNRVLVGVPAGATEADGTSLAKVAAVNEFGTAPGTVPEIPERSFLRAGIREGMPEFERLNRHSLKGVVEGTMTEDHALDLLGVAAVGAVKRKIGEGPFVPNAPSTIKRKGSSKPLIDTNTLRGGIVHRVVGP